MEQCFLSSSFCTLRSRWPHVLLRTLLVAALFPVAGETTGDAEDMAFCWADTIPELLTSTLQLLELAVLDINIVYISKGHSELALWPTEENRFSLGAVLLSCFKHFYYNTS